MTPLLLALGASLAWGVADFAGPLFSRTLGTLPVLLWAEAAGVAGLGIAIGIRGDAPAGWGVAYAILAAIGGMLGLWAYYHGMATGTMSVVAPIAGVSAVIPVAVGIVSGDSPSTLQLGGIACALAGVGLASIEHQEGRRKIAAGVGLALAAAAGFGFYFPWMHAAGEVDFWWASLVFRVTALVLVAGIVAQQRVSVRMCARNLVIASLVGLGDTLGNVLYAAASGKGGLISLTSVLASLYPVVTVLLAASVLKERVAVTQRAGVALTLAGVVLISI